MRWCGLYLFFFIVSFPWANGPRHTYRYPLPLPAVSRGRATEFSAGEALYPGYLEYLEYLEYLPGVP